MTQVSKRQLNRNVEEKVYESFYKVLGLLEEKEAKLFVGDLLTNTEKVMIPKRLAIAILLSRGWTYDDIRETLHVTQSTIAAVSKTLEFSNGLKTALAMLSENDKWNDWWQGIEEVLYRLSSPGRVFVERGQVKHNLGHKKKTLV